MTYRDDWGPNSTSNHSVACPVRAHADTHAYRGPGGNAYTNTNFTNTDPHPYGGPGSNAYTDPQPYSHAESRKIATAPGAISFPFDQSMGF